MVKHIHIYRIISFFALVVFLFPICAYSEEIQNSDGDMARQFVRIEPNGRNRATAERIAPRGGAIA